MDILDDLDYLDDTKRCPFCGTMVVLDEIRTVNWRGGLPRTNVKYIAQCPIKSCLGHHGKAYTNPEVAVTKWNMRVKDDLSDKEFCELIHTLKDSLDNPK